MTKTEKIHQCRLQLRSFPESSPPRPSAASAIAPSPQHWHCCTGSPLGPVPWHWHPHMTLDPAPDLAQQHTSSSQCPHRPQDLPLKKPVHTVWKTWLLLPVRRHRCKTRNVTYQENMTPPKEHKKFTVTDTREVEIDEFFDKEFKATVLKKLRATKEHR